MRRGILILVLGLAGAVIAYGCFYCLGTAKSRAWLQSPQPELAWIKQEFHLSDADFQRVAALHEGYLPQCLERCQRIGAFEAKLSNALASATQVTPELEGLLQERAQMRAACQAEMLKHFYAVSRTMPPEQGKRYLNWVLENTCWREQSMGHGPTPHAAMPMSAHQP